MTSTPTPPGTPERVNICCPGCGRHDYVTWPQGQVSLQWTCFNCQKTFVLSHKVKH